LIVDDDREMGRLLRTLFELEGHQVVVVASYSEVIDSLREVLPDVVVMDVHLQGEETIDLLPVIRQDAKLANTPLVLTSGMDLRREGLDAGANMFVLKPFLPDDLVAMVGRLLEEQSTTTLRDDVIEQ
jgi:DNA-binding response OmpR family regulator